MVGNRILVFVLCILNKFKDILVDMFPDVRWPEKSKLADKRSEPKAGGKSAFLSRSRTARLDSINVLQTAR